MANNKEVVRDQLLQIRLSKEEKDLFVGYAEDIGINPSRLARNLIMSEAESLITRYTTKKICRAYVWYAEVTKNQEVLDRLKSQ